ncbi:uncharacterized protein LOC117171135 [Belonocnema kinseyi]|uniref:uncharacterized protein LOC117171135 n=1 Tax=Belonocnema kinseyi TaxID=2817044 RepID=UPI00143DA7DA|nr:uncharacterized protein LOC117171135 [Belonocnema kinseyi]
MVEWLKYQDSYNLHVPIHRRFRRINYDISNIDCLWEADLVDLKHLKDADDGYQHLLVILDVLSKYVWVEPLKDKSANEVRRAFEVILDQNEKRSPACLHSDRGKEFLGAVFQNFLSTRGIRFRPVRDPNVKAAVAERYHRTLKEHIWRYFTHSNIHRYINVLQQILQGYNNSRHSSIRIRPSEVTLENAAHARLNSQRKYGRRALHGKKPKYKVTDNVRISRE